MANKERPMVTLSKTQKALLSAILGIVLTVAGYGISILTNLGYIPAVIGGVIGICIPLGIEEVEVGHVKISDLLVAASKITDLLSSDKALTPAEEAVVSIARVALIKNSAVPPAKYG